MKIVSGKSYDLDVILEKIILNLQGYINHLELGDYSTIKSLYETELFRKEKPSTFKHIEGGLLSGFIKGVSQSGHLQVLTEDAILKEFDLKEVKLLY
jgi:BirA family biotin operon repressor/biotin-[acetyl-CoA-carboxylase] ligase